jgi:hypothetical protein
LSVSFLVFIKNADMIYEVGARERLRIYMSTKENVFDFGHGHGPIPARRHKNPDETLGGWVANTAWVHPSSRVGKFAMVYGNAKIGPECNVSGYVRVYGNSVLVKEVTLYNFVRVYDNAKLNEGVSLGSNLKIGGDANIVFDIQTRKTVTVWSI